MGCRVLIGVTEDGYTYTAYYLQWGNHPVRMIPVLRETWQDTHHQDTTAMATAIRTPNPGYNDVDSGRLDEYVEDDLEWLFLLDEHTDTVEAYVHRKGHRWTLYSRHRLAAADDDLFVLDGSGITCSRCRTVDEIAFTTTGDTPTADTIITCQRCAASEISPGRP